MDISELRYTKSKLKERCLTIRFKLVNASNAEIFDHIHKNIPILHANEKMRIILERQHIVKITTHPNWSKSSKSTLQNNGHKVREIKLWHLSLIEGPVFKFKDGQTFKVKSNVTCSMENLIYVMACNGCQHNYLGWSGKSLCSRMTMHRQQIQDKEQEKIL